MLDSIPRLAWTVAIVLLSEISLVGCSAPQDEANSLLASAGATSQLPASAVELLRDEAFINQAFTIVRQVLAGEEPLADGLPDLLSVGSRVFVCLYDATGSSHCATGFGAPFSKALVAAGKQLKRQYPNRAPTLDPSHCRIKLDVVSRVMKPDTVGIIDASLPRDVGLQGVWVAEGHQASWLLPAEMLEKGLFVHTADGGGLLRKETIDALRQRNSDLHPGAESAYRYTRFETVSWIEREPQSPSRLRLYRLHPATLPPLSADDILQRTVWGADYLLSATGTNGKIRYEYDPVDDRESEEYSLPRHAGSAWGLLLAYRRTGFVPYLAAAEAAIRFTLSHAGRQQRIGPHGGGEVMYLTMPGATHVVLNTPALALIMLAEYAGVTGDATTYREEARLLARFLLSQQRSSGEFYTRPPIDPRVAPPDVIAPYAPGEAVLALIKWYDIDGDTTWLAAAVRGAEWLITVRDKETPVDRLASDHWLMMALAELYRHRRDNLYLKHALKLAKAVELQSRKNQRLAAAYPDYRGSYYDPPHSTAAATRVEGLAAVLDICAMSNLACDGVREVLSQTSSHLLLSQYTPDALWWPSLPAKALGGWSGGITDTLIRNDYVQHSLNALLGAERHLRLAADDDKSEQALNDQDAHLSMLEPAHLESLRSDTLRIRGKTPWEGR